jgi:hypothetical protein
VETNVRSNAPAWPHTLQVHRVSTLQEHGATSSGHKLSESTTKFLLGRVAWARRATLMHTVWQLPLAASSGTGGGAGSAGGDENSCGQSTRRAVASPLQGACCSLCQLHHQSSSRVRRAFRRLHAAQEHACRRRRGIIGCPAMFWVPAAAESTRTSPGERIHVTDTMPDPRAPEVTSTAQPAPAAENS